MTKPTELSLENRTLQGCCGHVVVVSCVTLDDMLHKRVVAITIEVQKPLGARHTTHNRDMRDVQACHDFTLDQCCGGYMQHLSEFVVLLFPVGADLTCGCKISGVKSPRLNGLSAVSDIDFDIVSGDEHASIFGQMILSMLSQRLRRGLGYLVWFLGMSAIRRP